MADLAGQIAAGMATLTSVRSTLLVDHGVATRPGDATQTPVLDADGNIVDPSAPVVYDGPCAVVQPKQAPLRNRTDNDDAGDPEERELQVPHTADLRTGDLFTVTASAFSPGMVGDVFVVVREDERSYATCRHYVLRGSSWQPPA